MAVQLHAGWPAPNAARLDWALFYAGLGWRVFPLASYAKVPQKGSAGFLDATTDPEQIRAWWGTTPKANIGLATGAGSGIVVLDEDPRNGGDADPLRLPPTLTALTWSGGRHFYYAHSAPLPSDHTGKIAKGIDAQGDGAYVVAPPSLIRHGGRQGGYRWDDVALALAPLPSRIVAALAPVPDNKVPTPGANGAQDMGAYWLEKALAQTHEGARNEYGHWLACQLRDSGMSQDAAEEWIRAYHAQVPGDGYTMREALASLKSAYKRTPREPARAQRAGLRVVGREEPPTPPSGGQQPPEKEPAPRFRLTEYGNTDRLIAAHGAKMHWSKEFGWLMWDGKRWRANSEPQVREWAKQTVRDLYAEAAGIAAHAAAGDTIEARRSLAETSEHLLKWATRSETDKVTSAMVSLAASACLIEGDAFDQQPWLFNAANGTIDLRTGTLRAPERADLLMQAAPVAYDPAAQCPTFARFLDEIMLGRDELVSYLQRALGYSLTGDVREQVWHLCVGEGANGKSTLFEAIEHVLGDYAAMVAPETITLSGITRDGAAPSPDIARLKGKRFCKITETEEGARIAPARVKSLTGGDMIMGRMLHRDPIEFRPTLKIWVYTNHKPQVRETTHAFWRRVRFIPFDFKAGDHPDPSLAEKLRAEAPGILAWLVRGCLEWQAQGLNPPPVVLDATGAYRDEQDTLKTFMDERCTVAQHAHVTAKSLYAAYTDWCEEAGERPQSQRRLGMALKERGFQRERLNSGFSWFGLGLLDT